MFKLSISRCYDILKILLRRDNFLKFQLFYWKHYPMMQRGGDRWGKDGRKGWEERRCGREDSQGLLSMPLLTLIFAYSFCSGPCLEQLPYNTEITLVGCNHQCSVSILWGGEGRDAFCLGINIACFFPSFLYTDEDHIVRNVCIKICTEIRSDCITYVILCTLYIFQTNLKLRMYYYSWNQ